MLSVRAYELDCRDMHSVTAIARNLFDIPYGSVRPVKGTSFAYIYVLHSNNIPNKEKQRVSQLTEAIASLPSITNIAFRIA